MYDVLKIKHIEFFPDYCSSGIWITYEDKPYRHVNAMPEDLPVEIPEWLENKIEAMNIAYDTFQITHGNDYEVDYSKRSFGWDIMAHQITCDFKKLFPEYAHLVVSRFEEDIDTENKISDDNKISDSFALDILIKSTRKLLQRITNIGLEGILIKCNNEDFVIYLNNVGEELIIGESSYKIDDEKDGKICNIKITTVESE